MLSTLSQTLTKLSSSVGELVGNGASRVNNKIDADGQNDQSRRPVDAYRPGSTFIVREGNRPIEKTWNKYQAQLCYNLAKTKRIKMNFPDIDKMKSLRKIWKERSITFRKKAFETKMIRKQLS